MLKLNIFFQHPSVSKALAETLRLIYKVSGRNHRRPQLQCFIRKTVCNKH